MLEEVNPLPRPQLQTSVSNRDRLARPGQGHPEVARGIVRSLGGVNQSGMILRNELLEEAMQIGTGRGIGILVDDETGTGVLDKDRGKARGDAASAEDLPHVSGDGIGPLAACLDFKGFGDGFHRWDLS